MRRSYGRRMIAFLMAFIMALSVLFQSDIAVGGIAQVLAAQSQNVATASDAEKQSDVGDSVATLAADDAIDLNADGYYCYTTVTSGKTYSGKPWTLTSSELVVKKIGDTTNDTKLSSDYYTVEYSNNVNVGTATVTVRGNADMNCSGTLTCTFTIKAKSITSTALFYIDGKEKANQHKNCKNKIYTYQAGGVWPQIYVKTANTSSGYFLTEGTDYVVDYYNNDEESEVVEDPLGDGPRVVVSAAKNSNYKIGSDGEYYIYYGISAANLSDQEISLEGDTFVYTGKPIKPAVKILDKTNNKYLHSIDEWGTNDYEYKVEYTNNTDVGTATVTITGAPTRFKGTVTKTFQIVDQGTEVYSIADADVTVDDDLVYDGTAKTPSPVVKYKGTTLVEGKDYKVSYYTNNTNASTSTSKPSLTISGLGSYVGSKTVNFTIKPRSTENLSVTFDDAVFNTANNITIQVSPQNISVKDKELGTTLKLSQDFSYDFSEYWNAKDYNVGTHKFNIVGIGNYTGTVPCGFQIVAADISKAVITADDAEYTGSEVTTTLSKVTFSNTDLVEGVDYEISGYENNVEIGNSARVMIKGLGNFQGTCVGTFAIKTSKISMNDVEFSTISSMKYTGAQLKPDVTLTYDGKTLVEGTDYSVAYGENIVPGTNNGKVTFTGMGDYAGTVYKSFNILAKSFSDADVKLTVNKSSYEYTGENIKPDITITYNGMTLVEGVNYTFPFSYKETGTWTVIAMSASVYYSGSKSFQITIVAPSGDMGKLTYEDIPDQYYNGGEVKPELTIKNGSYVLKEGTDFTVTDRKNNDKVGTSTITIEGMGSYSGTKVLEFNILPKPLEDCDVKDISDSQYTGEALEPAVTIKNGSVELEQDVDYTVEYSNNTDVTDEAKVVIKAANDNYTGEIVKYFKITPVSIISSSSGMGITQADQSQMYTGMAIEPVINVTRYVNGEIIKLERDKDYTVEYANNIEVTGSGEKASITVTGIGNYTGQKVIRFEIEKRAVYNCQMDAIADQLWTGSAITPEINIYNGEIKLVENEDYTVEYADNTDAGKASVTITGCGDHYTGQIIKYFNITKEFIDISTSDKITLTGLEDQSYNFGMAVRPSFTLSYDGEEMTAGSNGDYTYTFKDNYEVGTATLVITGVGKYKGTKEYTFKIAKYDISGDTLIISGDTFEYSGTAIKPSLVAVKVGTVNRITSFDDFNVTYGENTNVGNGSVTITPKADSSYTGELTQKFVIYKKSITGATVSASSVTYTGKAQTPAVTVTCKDGMAVPSGSYSVEYANNINVGTAKITVTALEDGNFDGTATGSFEIKAIDIAGADVADIADQTYTGSAITPDITVSYDGTELVEGEDYVVSSYDNNENVSTASAKASITITGKGVYSGTKKIEFNIVPASVSKAVVTGVEDSVVYTGADITFVGLAVTVSGRKLTAADYTVKYTNNRNASTTDSKAEILITGKGNYTGEKIVQFVIEQKDIADCTVQPISAQIYTGKAVEPEVTVTDGANTLVKGTDYTVAYSNNINVTTTESKAVADISGTGNYKGSVKATFDIAKKIVKITDADVADIADQTYHMGDKIEPAATVTVDGVKLDADCYTVTYTNNVNVGTATMTVTGITVQGYSGTVEKTFKILPLSIAKAVASKTYSAVYTPAGTTFTVESFDITVDGKKYTVTDMSDFTVTQKNLINVGTGTITVTAKADCNFTGSFDIAVTITAAKIEESWASLEQTEFSYTGSEITPEPVVRSGNVILKKDVDYTLSYDSNVECSDKASVMVTGTGNYTGEVKLLFTIGAKSLTGAKVSAQAQSYTGKPLTTKISVELGDEKLVEGQDYTVEYVEGEVTNAGTGKFKIKGKGNYTGELDGTFVINARSINAEGIMVAGVADKTYTGFEITQDITVKDGDAVLTEGTDYTVDYENNVNASTTDSKAAVIVRGKGNYDSSITRRVEFTIGQKDITDAEMDGVESSVVYTGKAITFDQAVLTVDGVKLVNGVDYETEYVNNLNVSTASSKANIIFSAKGNYTGKASWTFTITAKSIEDCTVSDIPGQTHTGKALTPDITVKDGSRTLVKGTDYDVVYSDNIEVSTADKPAKAVVTGKGNYTGSVQKTFMIAERVIDITPAVISITDKGPFVYNYGKQITPAISVTLDGEVLPEDAYTVSYQSNVNAGKAYIIVTGAGEYHGVIDTSFTIEQLDVTGGVLELEKDAYGYTGSEIKPLVTGITLAGGSIEPGTDFDVTYSNNINVGSGEIALTARSSSNYKGTVTGKFAITAADITDAQLTVADQTYTGAALKPAVTVYLGQTKLIEGTDYTVGYADNTDAGTATVTVKGMGNYAGTVKTTFKIAARSISAAKITVADQVYTGAPLTPEITVTLGGKQIADTEYDVDYSGNTDKGTATVTITGKHNYTGTASETFTISAMDISKCVVSPIASVVYDGTAHSPKVTVKNGEIVLTEDSDYDVTYSDNVSVTTDSRKAKATITGRGNYTGQCVAEFEITKADFADAVITGIPESVEYTGESIVLTGYELTLGDTKLVENQDYVVEYTDNKEIGTATVRFIGAGNYSGEKTAAFKITKADIANCEISPIQGQTWTGKAIEPVLTIKNGSVTLKAGTDYEVTYSNNIDETDEAKAEITGIGNYTGTAVVYFSITRSVVDINGATVSAIPTQTYAFGKAVTPSVTVMYNGITLKENTDYTLTYENNINAGTAYVIITGTKYYSKTKRVSFAINPADISAGRVVIDQESFVYTGKSQKPEVTGIEFGDVMITDMDSFDISFGSNVNVGTASISVSAKSNTNYKGSVTGEFAITEADLSGAAVEVDDAVYQGTPLTPAVRVTLGTVVLTEGRDYTLSYSSNTNVGKGTVKITGSGNYKGTVSAEFAITERTITDADVEVADQIYTGKELTPDVEVTLGDKLLTNGVDYTVTYEKNVNVGTANVIVKGTGNYKDTITKTFRIAAADISSAVAYKISDQTYTGSPITPAVTVSMADGTTLKAGVDYEAEYTGNTDVTTKDAPAQVVITGKGNYVGTLRTTFAIVPKSLTGVAISGYSESVAYTGADVTFADIIVADGSEILTEGIDYRITYTGNKAVTTEDGTYFTVTGTGNYTGSKDVHFVITAKDLRECDVEEIESQIYTGKAIEPEVTIRNGNVLLVSNVDYDVTYESNINETTETTKAKAIITGKGNYTGKLTVYFDITAKTLTAADVDSIDAQEYTGEAIEPVVVVRNGDTVLVAGRDYDVTYSNNTDKTTEARAVVKGKGNYQGTVTKLFEICGASIAPAVVTGIPESAEYTGDSITFKDITVVMNGKTLVYGTDYTVSYENNVNATTEDSMAYVIIKGNDNYGGQIRTAFSITPRSLEKCKVDAIGGQTYTGREITPEVTVRDGSKVLENGRDYTVSYSDNIEVGKNAKAVIEGKGNYTGQLTAEFTIAKEVLDISNAVISDIADQYYNFGEELTPALSVNLGGRKLTENVDYSVTYTDNIEAGTATATVKGIDQNKGEVSKTFKILPIDITTAEIALVKDSYGFTGDAVTADVESITVTRNGVKKVLTDLAGFEITCTDNVNVGTATVKIAAGEGQSYTGSTSTSFRIVAASIEQAEVSVDSAVYTGSAITPVCRVVLGGKTLAEGVDYKVTVSGNVNVTDNALVTIEGTGNYTGKLSQKFSITPKRISQAEVKADDAEYTGSAVTTTVSVVLDGKTLVQGTDYKLSYSDNVNVTSDTAKAVVTVTGTGNYTGTVQGEFSITPMDISKLDIPEIPDQTYGGQAVKPELRIVNGNNVLSEGTDYTVAYENNDSVTDKASAIISGRGSYKGSVTRTFAIKAYSIDNAEISGIQDAVVFTGDAIEFADIAVVVNGRTLVNGTDYTVSYENNLNVTDEKNPAYVIIKGTGNYGGQVRTAFAITAKNIGRCSIDPIGGQIYTGKAVEPEITVRDGARILETGKDYDITYSNNTDVTDSAEVTITGKGNYRGSNSAVFTITQEVVDISKAVMSKVDDQYYNFGNAIRPEVTLTYGGKTLTQDVDYELVYIDNINEGTATIQANGINKNTGSVSTTFAIKPVDITTAEVVLENDSFEYTGSEIRPAVKMITVSRDGKATAVTSMTAFDVTYTDNTNVGTAGAVIKAAQGSGFTGSVTKKFEITEVDIAQAVVDVEDHVYTGSAVKPAYTVTLDGKKLTAGTDFNVVFSNNVNVGTAAILTVTGTGNYKGTVVAYFAITAKDLSKADVNVQSSVYTGKPLTPAVTVTLDDEILNADIDYVVSYSNNVNATTAKSKATVTVKGTGNYKGTVTATFDIEPKAINEAKINDILDQMYSGSEIRPDAKVTLDGVQLVAGTDYTVTYENNIEVSDSAKLIVTGKGNYKGTVEKNFSIKSLTLEDAEVSGIPAGTEYTGKAITFGEIVVTLVGKKLSEDEDYTVEYKNNVNVTDSAEVVITGIGNYSGELSRTFKITAKDISKCRVDAIGGQVHTGKAVTPEVTVRDGTQVLVSGTDYKTEYSNNINETTASSKAEIKITGSGNYTGSITVNFTISKNLVDISKAVISKISDQLYNFGQPLTPDVTVTFGGKTLVYGEDYALVYVDNIDEGVATVTVRGINSNTGSLSAKFNINPVDISDGQIALDASEYMYTGTAVKPVINSFTVKRAGKTVTVTDFDNLEISYSSNTNVGTGKVTIKALEGEGFTGSVSKTFAIVGASVDNASVKVGNGVYTGEAVTPDHTVTLGGRTLVEGRDYRADYSNNVNVTDSAVLTITGMGNYSGSTTARFKISARNLADADITVASARYTGDPLTPAVTVSLGGTALVEDRDFTVSYSDNVNVTTDTDKAGVTITGIGNYTGTAVEKFDIAARDISLAEIKDIDRQNYTGNAVTPKLTVVDGQRELVAGRDYTVSYKNNVEVTTAAVAVITGKGNYSGTASKLFAIGGADIADADITGIKDSVTYTGKAITFAGLKVTYGDDVLVAERDYTVSYSGNKNVTDKASVTITGIGNYTGSVNRYFAITRRNLADCHVSEIEGQIYTGKKIEPELTITYGDLVLVEGVDYEIEYSNNIEPTAGGQSAKATVTGKRSYTGTVEREFTITKDPVNISGAKISAIPDQEFAKKNITPAVNVTYGGKTLVQGTDYKVSYINNYNVGTATVTITGYGDYVSSKTATFEIVKRDVTGYVAELSKSSMTYTGKALTPSVTAINSSDGAFVLDDEDIAGFIVRYASNVNVGTATVTATAGSRSNYTGSVTATFAITAASIDNAVVVAEDTEYTGKPVTPAVTVTVNGVVLSAADYTVAYSNNTEVGTAEVSITGKGNYTGETTGTFEITARSIKNCTVECSTSIEYTGNQLIPVVKVKNGDVELTEGVDYILSFDMNTDVTGRAKVVVTGKGNYKDSVTRYFAITKKSIAGAEIKGITGKVFTGNAITQDIEVELDGQKLSQGTDYTVKYENNVHVGTAVITLTGAGNYTDSVKKSFVISKADISNTAVINGIESEVIYKGTAFKFDNVTITWGTNVLKEGRDYTITYQNNSGITMTRTSKASVTVKFMGDYKGSVTKQFRIKAFDISKATVSAIADKTYTGSAIKPAVTVKIGRTVINPKEYTVEYSNNVKPGVASVTITGLNNFYGTKKVTFNILPAKVKNLAASGETTTSLKLSWSSSAYAQGYEVYRYDTGKKTYVKVATVTGTSSNITGLAAGTDYKFAISAYVKSSGKTLYSEKTVINAATKPAKVSGISFSSRAEKSIALKWNTVKGATGYKVYRLVAKDNYKYLGSTSKTAYNVNGLTGSTAYTFKVVAYKKVGSKELVGEDATARIMTTPSAVKNLKISARSNASITMKWSKVNNADGYIVYRYRGNRAVKIKTITSKSKVVFVSSKLSAGTTYKYRVVAYKKDGKAIVENAGTYVSGFTLPATPVVSAKAGVKQAKIAWKRAKGATGYIVYMSTSKRGTYKAVATIRKAGTTSYTKKGLKKGKTYYFKVRAFNKSGKTTYKSSYSTVKKIVVK